jgi:hypothetical protein
LPQIPDSGWRNGVTVALLLHDITANKSTPLAPADSGDSLPLVGDHLIVNGAEYAVQQRVFDYAPAATTVILRGKKVA